MATDDDAGDDPQQDRGENGKPTRDAKGRWLPDYCPNPKGRPKNQPKVLLDRSDIRDFGNTLVDVVAIGQKETMDRRTALLIKMFESAMKGRVSMQRYLYEAFAKNDERLAALRLHYERPMLDWYINNPEPGKPYREMPFEVELEIQQPRTLLNHYYPSQYSLHGMSANDDDEDDDG